MAQPVLTADSSQGSQSPRHDRLLPWIAAERGLRAVVLIALGVVLITHPQTNWAQAITHLANRSGLNPSSNAMRKIVDAVHRIPVGENTLFGAIALGYGALEAAESYGLARRRPWGERLTLVATSILLVPEVWELSRKATPLKAGALAINLLVVAYLYRRLRRGARGAPRMASSAPAHRGAPAHSSDE